MKNLFDDLTDKTVKFLTFVCVSEKKTAYLEEALRCSELYSHSPPPPTRMADRTEEWADSQEPLPQRHTHKYTIERC